MIRNASIKDAAQIRDIYNFYIRHSVSTLEETPVDIKDMEALIKKANVQFPLIVFEENNQVLGYAYASPWNIRSGYKQTVETTIYLKNNSIKRGMGTQLYNTLLSKLKNLKYKVIIGGISLPNEASVALHEKFGYKKVAHFTAVGYKLGNWVDVGYWELQLNKYR